MSSEATDAPIEMNWLRKWAQYSPKAVAFKDAESGDTYTYAGLHAVAIQLARALQQRFALKHGDRVAVLATNELEYVALFFALQRLGVILVPMNFRLTARELSHILQDSEPVLLISQAAFTETVKAVGSGVLPKCQLLFDGARDSLSSLIREFRACTETPHDGDFAGTINDTCMILYTSGTTGAPKGAMITNKMLHWNSINTSIRLNLSDSDVFVSFLPLFHTGGWNVLLTPFVHRGARTILLRKFDADQVLELSEKEGATILFGVPTTLEMMSRSTKFADADLKKIRYAVVGGEPMSRELIHAWQRKGIAIRQGYGLTEFGPNVFSLNEEDAIRKIGSIGFANFYVETRVVDASNKDVAQGEIGELILRGPACSPGYWRNETATQAAIRDGWLHTGDLVRVDSEGYVYVAGRKKEMFISGAENVYPVEVEQFISSHPAVREVGVVGVPCEKWGEKGRAFISLKAGANLSEAEVIEFCAQGLAKYKVPREVVFMHDLPKGDSGKILKRLLLNN